MLETLKQPWPWYVAGALIGLTVPYLLLVGNKTFGISSSLRHLCAACFPGDVKFFKYDWRKEAWNLFFVGGIALGAYIGATLLADPNPIELAEPTKAYLAEKGITDTSSLLPPELFSWENLFTVKGLVFFVLGGFLVGFGTAYAGGCTTGHAIFGLADLQLPSLIAVLGFFAGGLLATHYLLPLIF